MLATLTRTKCSACQWRPLWKIVTATGITLLLCGGCDLKAWDWESER
jgi:hypothetical protein